MGENYEFYRYSSRQSLTSSQVDGCGKRCTFEESGEIKPPCGVNKSWL